MVSQFQIQDLGLGFRVQGHLAEWVSFKCEDDGLGLGFCCQVCGSDLAEWVALEGDNADVLLVQILKSLCPEHLLYKRRPSTFTM